MVFTMSKPEVKWRKMSTVHFLEILGPWKGLYPRAGNYEIDLIDSGVCVKVLKEQWKNMKDHDNKVNSFAFYVPFCLIVTQAANTDKMATYF